MLRSASLMAMSLGCLLVLSCDDGREDDDFNPTNQTSGPEFLYCDVPETTAQTVNTSRAGEVPLCSAAWVEVGNTACISPSQCAAEGKTCMKVPGELAHGCLQPCGDGSTVCAVGESCRMCEDSSPHCASSSQCPRPRVRRFDNQGNECSGSADTAQPPDPGLVASECSGFREGCTVECFSSSECCNSSTGLPQFCERFQIGDDYSLRSTCQVICSSASDCGSDPSVWCCVASNSRDSSVSVTTKDGQPATVKTCYARGVYDFCPALSGGGGGGGGGGGDPDCYSDCLRSCSEVGGSTCSSDCADICN